MNRNYVSEFTLFMDQFLRDHPEVVADQKRGWAIHWNPRGDHYQQPVEFRKPEDLAPGHANDEQRGQP